LVEGLAFFDPLKRVRGAYAIDVEALKKALKDVKIRRVRLAGHYGAFSSFSSEASGKR
jgi:DUF971 family protein